MTIFRLILRSLAYFRGVNLAVAAGVAVATAVLSGALMVGDSVRGSLVDLAVRRLGKVDAALIGGRFFDASLAERISNDPALKGRFEIGPTIITLGGASTDSGTTDSGTARTAGVQIIGAGGNWAPVPSGSVIINSQTAGALDLQTTGDVVFSVPAVSDIPTEATLAHRSRQDVLSGLRARVISIASDAGMLEHFSTTSGQRSPLNAWVNLRDLQDAVGQRGQANTLLVRDNNSASDVAEALNAALRRTVTLADYGLSIGPVADGTEAALVSRTTYVDPPVEAVIDKIADDQGISLRKVSVNLINAVNRLTDAGEVAGSIHYAVCAGITSLGDTTLGDDEIALNDWAATQLGAKVGDRITLTFYARESGGRLVEVGTDDLGSAGIFRVVRILSMSGLGADPSLSPAYKGLTDATSIASWDPPAGVNIDKSRVTQADENYWKQYKAAPKLFVSFASARRLWGAQYGDTTSIRVPATRAGELESKILANLDPALMGMSFRPLRKEQIAAASGTTDFGQLFIGFSFFLIVAAALLIAMLFRLGVEQRGRQLGAMAAVGFAPKSLRRLMLYEGMFLSLCGGVGGTFAAIGYTWLMMAGLRTWWVDAVGTTAMRLHVMPMTLVIGFIASQFVASLAILWAVRQVGRSDPARLLAGGWEGSRPLRNTTAPIARTAGIVGLAAGAALIGAGIYKQIPEQAAFLGGGAVFLASGLCFVGVAFRPRRTRDAALSNIHSVARLGIRNVTRHTARSVLCIGLMAIAAFALVTVSAMRRGEPNDTAERRSGSGGYQLIVDSQIPLRESPATVVGRELLGFREPANPVWDRVEFMPMRRRAGEDISCLNITQASNPTITGVPSALIERGGFAFASVPNRDPAPWKLLEQPIGDSDDIPIFTDDSTAKYSLHLSPGDTLELFDHAGVSRRLRLVATLAGSVFQGTILMSDANLRRLYPASSDFGVVLVRVDPSDQHQVLRLLSDDLGEYAASVRTTASILAAYFEVQNTYLSTFQVLGALGLMLGTIGLAVVLVRTVIERRGELALLASLGFTRGARLRLVLAENTFLLVGGLMLGTACAIIGVLPTLRESGHGVNFFSLGVTLIAALMIGLLASGLAALYSSTFVAMAELRR